MKKIQVKYFALVGARRGVQTEAYETEAGTARQLLREIEGNKRIPLTTNISKAMVNGKYVEWDAPINDGDLVTLLSPFSGG